MLSTLNLWFQCLFILYFLGLNVGYLLLDLIACFVLRQQMNQLILQDLPKDYYNFMPLVSILIPAYNEEKTIVSSVRSVLQLDYPHFEVIVINDGSRDQTLAQLIEAFALEHFPILHQEPLETQPVKALYRSMRHPQLLVIDKHNGGKADSLNAGANLAQGELLCCLDADSILQRNSLEQIIAPFLLKEHLVCCGGTVRIANGCRIQEGFLVETRLSKHPLAILQTLEYLRAFLFGRLGWAPLNALMIISGAFGVFNRSVLIACGGYRTHTIGEDMELTLRIHQYLRQKKAHYQIDFLANPICWTEVPEDLKTLKNQRVRWQRGLLESLWLNRRLLFHRRGGALSWLAFPFFLIFEALGPLLEVAGYLYMFIGLLGGWVSHSAMGLFFLVSCGLGMILSISALLLEELSFHLYPRFREMFLLLLAALVENIGYRQLNSWWRFQGILLWLSRRPGQWGQMTRKGHSQ